MTPEEVPEALVDAAAQAMWAAEGLTHAFQWPSWDEALKTVPHMAAQTLVSARHGLAAVLPEYGAEVLITAAHGCRPGEERVASMLVRWAQQFDGIRMAETQGDK